jgi:hypothetical protein
MPVLIAKCAVLTRVLLLIDKYRQPFWFYVSNVMNPKERRNERITPVREYLEIN